jgi:hypothetical protein
MHGFAFIEQTKNKVQTKRAWFVTRPAKIDHQFIIFGGLATLTVLQR